MNRSLRFLPFLLLLFTYFVLLRALHLQDINNGSGHEKEEDTGGMHRRSLIGGGGGRGGSSAGGRSSGSGGRSPGVAFRTPTVVSAGDLAHRKANGAAAATTHLALAVVALGLAFLI